jgi:hypothetical protein
LVVGPADGGEGFEVGAFGGGGQEGVFVGPKFFPRLADQGSGRF